MSNIIRLCVIGLGIIRRKDKVTMIQLINAELLRLHMLVKVIRYEGPKRLFLT